MTAEAKIAQGRMTLVQLAEPLRNVSEACRQWSCRASSSDPLSVPIVSRNVFVLDRMRGDRRE
jgi:hypothetical protein